MTKLDEMIERIQADQNSSEVANDLLTKLIEARDSLSDPADAETADHILEQVMKDYLAGALGKATKEDIEGNVDQEYMDTTTAAVEEAFASQGWRSVTKRVRRKDVIQYELGFSIDNTSIRVFVYVEDLPKRILIRSILPFIGDKTYEYLLCKEIVDANNRFNYGAFKYDPDGCEITYEYSYPTIHGFHVDHFLALLHAVIRTSVDDEVFPLIKKAAQGRYKRTEREEILKNLSVLVDDLTD